MGKFHEDKVYGIKIRESANDGSDFSNPDADYRLAFIGEDGQWHLKDSAGNVTDLGSSGKYDPDGAPATTPAVSDEFDDASLDVAWGWDSAPATADEATYPGYLFIEGDTTERHLNRAWTPGATNVTIAAKLAFAEVAAEAGPPSVALYVGDATGNPANAVLAMLTGATLAGFTEDGAGSFTQRVSRTIGPQVNRQAYVRMTRTISDNSWRWYYSVDGIAWSYLGTSHVKALTIGALGFRLDTTGQVVIDWVRAWTSLVTKVGS